MKIGIIFGGQSREREVSFAGGRTVYDNLNKNLFTPVPIFVDSLGNFILLNWENIYKGTIRDFYPAASFTPDSPHYFQIYAESLTDPAAIDGSIAAIGRKVQPEELPNLIDFAFLTLHGPYGEDGNIQGLLEWYGVPYSGAGILPGSIGIDKEEQKKILHAAGFESPDSWVLTRDQWQSNPEDTLWQIETSFAFPLVVKAPHQGSSIGVSIVSEQDDLENAIDRAFFIQKLDVNEWRKWNDEQKRKFLISFTDIREGLGFPVYASGKLVYHPEDLWQLLDTTSEAVLNLQSPDGESRVLIEAFVKGREFSCIVIEDESGEPIALPPTEIRKSKDLFDYRSKYLPGISRKITPIQLPEQEIQRIRTSCERLYKSLHSQVYARLDGFYTTDGKIILNDPNTTSGMLPSSFFFHQAAEIGLNPSQFITYIISTSLRARIKSGKRIFHTQQLHQTLEQAIKKEAAQQSHKIHVGVIMGGFSSERHISVESGRNIFEKLSASEKYLPVPIFLTGDEAQHLLYQLPINIMLKDNADDIREKVTHPGDAHPVTAEIINQTAALNQHFTAGTGSVLRSLTYDDLPDLLDFAFIALHGRPGEDGAMQQELEKRGIPYNGSGVTSSRISINKYDTNELLDRHGILVAKHRMVFEDEYRKDQKALFAEIEQAFPYPIIAKPADDGCSSAVKKIKNRAELEAFCEMMFRPTVEFPTEPSQVLNLKNGEEFPQKTGFLIEELIGSNGAGRFLEITGGMLTHMQDDGTITYEVFEPSETLASGEILSLEEKFLAGEGQNITPARFAKTDADYLRISTEVKKVLEQTARIVQVEGYCRIDAFVRVFPDKVETIIIEINSLPGMTPATAIFHQSALNKMKPYDFIDRIIQFGFARQKIRSLTNQ